jgi:hypothetical protein
MAATTYGYGFLFDAMVRIAEAERDALMRLCPTCEGDGCERCNWKGEVEPRELPRVAVDPDDLVSDDPERDLPF